MPQSCMRAAAIGQTRKHGNRKGMNNGNREQSGCKVFQKTSHALTLIENWQELSHDLTACAGLRRPGRAWPDRSEEHTSELQSLMRISYAVFCLKKNINKTHIRPN